GVLTTVERDATLEWRAPSIDLGPGTINHAPGRIPRGRYLAARCVRRADVEMCRAQRADLLQEGPTAGPLELSVPSGTAALVVTPRDELGRPIESTFVLLGPPDYRPQQLRDIEVGWLRAVADHPDAIMASSLVHGAASARFEHVPPGRYTICSAAL